MVFELFKSIDVFVKIDFHSWPSHVSDRLSQVRCVGVKYRQVVLTYEHGDICKVVDCIESKSEPTNLFSVVHFSRFI